MRNDFSLTNDLAASQPAKLKEMQGIFAKQAIENHVFPIDDRSIERFDAAVAGRPDLMGGRTSLTVYEGMTGMSENAFINLKNTSFTITAEIVAPEKTAEGAIIAQGGRFGGWSFYVKDGKPTYCSNFVALDRYTITSTKALTPGKATVRLEFVSDGGKLGAGGVARLYINGEKVGEGRVEKTNGMLVSLEEGADVGADLGTNVCEDYESPFRFNGQIDHVTLNVAPTHLSPESQSDLDAARAKADASAE